MLRDVIVCDVWLCDVLLCDVLLCEVLVLHDTSSVTRKIASQLPLVIFCRMNGARGGYILISWSVA